jgi:hypothetical protein
MDLPQPDDMNIRVTSGRLHQKTHMRMRGQTIHEGAQENPNELGNLQEPKFLIRMSPPVSTRRFYNTP